MATPMLRSLHKSGHSVDLALFNSANKILLKSNGFLQNIFVISSMLDYLKLLWRYDALVATAGTNPKKVRLLAKLLGIKSVFSASQEKDIHRIDMNLKIVQPLLTKIEKEPNIYINGNEEILKKYLKEDEKNIGFAVGSGSKQSFKRWHGYRELIKKTSGNKLLFIGPDELELEKEFLHEDVTVVKENLEDTIKLISKLDLIVGNDNGLMHMAYATKRNSVTIYGMTNEKETGGYRQNNEAVFLDMECRPCFDPATDRVGCKTYDCLRELSVEEVWKTCQKFL